MAALLACACTGPGAEPPRGPSLNGGNGAPTAGRDGGDTSVDPSVPADASIGNPDDNPPQSSGGMGGQAGGDMDSGLPSTEVDGGGPTYETEELEGPTYMGSVSNSADCSLSYPTRGFAPSGASGARYPLFLYFVGTAFVATDPSAQHDSPAPLAVTEALARRGFVALSVKYDNDALAWLSDHTGQLACLFEGGKPESLIAKACALPNVDCELGIATWGHSQGAYVAHAAHNLEPRVRATWTTGYGGDASSTLPSDRLRVVNGEADAGDNGTAAKLMMITELSAEKCTEPDQCLREDGSGWIIVRKSELAMPDVSTADHCWFDRQSCTAGMIVLEPNWVEPASDKAFALEKNADWVARTIQR
jgi:hypothetical protein